MKKRNITLLVIGIVVVLLLAVALKDKITGKVIITPSPNVLNCSYYDFNCDNRVAYDDINYLKEKSGRKVILSKNISRIDGTKCSNLNKYLNDLRSLGITKITVDEAKKVSSSIRACRKTSPTKISEIVARNRIAK